MLFPPDSENRSIGGDRKKPPSRIGNAGKLVQWDVAGAKVSRKKF